MLLYHGSNVEVSNPRIIISNRNLDFGPGFYTTSDREQAVRWAAIQTRRRHSGHPVLNIYEFDEAGTADISLLRFSSPDRQWLHFVSDNRKGVYSGPKYDMVIGPVANDNTMPVINNFISGTINEETALTLLKPQELKDQYVFLTWKGLSLLTISEVKYYD